MKLNRTPNPLDRNARNGENDNWDIIEGEIKSIGNMVDDFIEEVSNEALGKVVDNAKLNWKEPVDSFGDLPSSAEEGDTRMDKSTGKVYRYDGTNWVEIQQIDAGPVNELDSRLSSQLAEKATKEEFQNKTKSIVSLVEYGAIGDYNETTKTGTDNYQPLVDSFQTLEANGGGILIIPDGKYFVNTNTTIEIPSNIVIYCLGELVYPETRTRVFLSILNKKNIQINTLKVNGSFLDPTKPYSDRCHALQIRSSVNIHIINPHIRNTSGDAIYIGRDYSLSPAVHCDGITIDNPVLHNTKRNAFAMVTGRNVTINNPKITSDDGEWNISAAFDLEPNNTSEVFENILVTNLIIEANAKEIVRMLVGDGKEPEIMNNITFTSINIKTKPNYIPSRAIAFNGAYKGTNINFGTIKVEGKVDVAVQLYKIKDNLTVDKLIVTEAITNALLISYNGNNVTVSTLDLSLSSDSEGRACYVYNNIGENYSFTNVKIDNANSPKEAFFIDGNERQTKNVIVDKAVIKNAPKSLRLFKIDRLRYMNNELSGELEETYNTNVFKLGNTVNGVFPAQV